MLLNFISQLCMKKLNFSLTDDVKSSDVKSLNNTLLQIYNIYNMLLRLINSYNLKKKQLIQFITVNITDYKIMLKMFWLTSTDSVIAWKNVIERHVVCQNIKYINLKIFANLSLNNSTKMYIIYTCSEQLNSIFSNLLFESIKTEDKSSDIYFNFKEVFWKKDTDQMSLHNE